MLLVELDHVGDRALEEPSVVGDEHHRRATT